MFEREVDECLHTAPSSNDIFARSKYEPEHELDAAIAKVGYNIKDVKMIIIVRFHEGMQVA